MNDLMIDIETLGSRPGSVIASIGAVEFDATSGAFGRELYVTIDVASADEAGLTIDAETIKWWLRQSEEARANTFGGTEHLNMGLISLQTFVQEVSPVRIWAHSPSFDLVMLETAFRKTHIRCPWGHRIQRDTRTIFDLADVKLETTGVHHDALDDAKAQAAAVITGYRKLQLSSTPLANPDPEFDASREVTREEVEQWAASRADDAGYLARQLIASWKREAETTARSLVQGSREAILTKDQPVFITGWDIAGSYTPPEKVFVNGLTYIPETSGSEADDICLVCRQKLMPTDLCASDIELGICHAACLEGSPTVDLQTGEPVDGPIPTYLYNTVVPAIGARHPDDQAVDRFFAEVMKAKLAKKRTEGRGGWEDKEQCSNEFLSRLLRDHVEKGDPVDVANLAMMIHQRGEHILPVQAKLSSRDRGIELAARFVQKRLDDYCSEHGVTGPDTGTVEYPGNGEEYVYELEEIVEGILALDLECSK